MSVGGGRAMALELGHTHHRPAVSYSPQPSPEALQEQKKQRAKKREASWVGEWNRGDMQEVQQQLRALKSR